MKLTISRESLLIPLQSIAGVVERKQTMPVLSNVLLVAEDNHLTLTGTNMEVELVARVSPVHVDQPGRSPYRPASCRISAGPWGTKRPSSWLWRGIACTCVVVPVISPCLPCPPNTFPMWKTKKPASA